MQSRARLVLAASVVGVALFAGAEAASAAGLPPRQPDVSVLADGQDVVAAVPARAERGGYALTGHGAPTGTLPAGPGASAGVPKARSGAPAAGSKANSGALAAGAGMPARALPTGPAPTSVASVPGTGGGGGDDEPPPTDGMAVGFVLLVGAGLIAAAVALVGLRSRRDTFGPH